MRIQIWVSAVFILLTLNACGSADSSSDSTSYPLQPTSYEIVNTETNTNTNNNNNNNTNNSNAIVVSPLAYAAPGVPKKIGFVDTYQGQCLSMSSLTLPSWSLSRPDLGVTLQDSNTCTPTVTIPASYNDADNLKVIGKIQLADGRTLTNETLIIKRQAPVIGGSFVDIGSAAYFYGKNYFEATSVGNAIPITRGLYSTLDNTWQYGSLMYFNNRPYYADPSNRPFQFTLPDVVDPQSLTTNFTLSVDCVMAYYNGCPVNLELQGDRKTVKGSFKGLSKSPGPYRPSYFEILPAFTESVDSSYGVWLVIRLTATADGVSTTKDIAYFGIYVNSRGSIGRLP